MIITVTLNPGLDRTLIVPDLRYNEVLRSSSVRLHWGGKGFNVSRALKVLGKQSLAIGFLGGSTGQKIENGLKSLGIHTDFVRVQDETRTNTVILEDRTGKHIKVNEPGSIIRTNELEACA